MQNMHTIEGDTQAHDLRFAIVALRFNESVVASLIRGATAQFRYVAGECARGLAHRTVESGVPIAFGVLTTDTIEQAMECAGSKNGNKGAEAAVTAIEMANLLRQLDG